MANLKLTGIKGSEILWIEAAVLEVLEEAQFDLQDDVDISLRQSETEGVWNMRFEKAATNLAELSGIQSKLGKDFTMSIFPKDKTRLVIMLEAPKEEFTKLLNK